MKKILSILMTIVLVLCLVGCDEATLNDMDLTHMNASMEFWTDAETGVQYIVYQDVTGEEGGITPRLNADGTLYITTEKGSEQE